MLSGSDISLILGIFFIFLMVSGMYYIGNNGINYNKLLFNMLILILIFAVLYNINKLFEQDSKLKNYNIGFVIFLILLILLLFYYLHNKHLNNNYLNVF